MRFALRMMCLALVVADLSGCTVLTKKMYTGPELMNDEVAVLEEGDAVRVLGIDGRSVTTKYIDSVFHQFELKAGIHTIQASLEQMQSKTIGEGYYEAYQELGYTSPVREIKMDFLAGHRYQINPKKGLSVKEWEPEISDITKK